MKVAILIDGGFYHRRAQLMLGIKSAEERATELAIYCIRHLKHGTKQTIEDDLYKIFYYDCLPTDKKLYHPFLHKQIDYSKTDLYKWMIIFIDSLKRKRKFVMRLGRLAQKHDKICFSLRPETLKDLCNGKREFNNLMEDDFFLSIEQKGVDMKLGLDIASLAYKKQVDKIILISGDSDFVPAAKLARREGIDFILDPLFNHIAPDLSEHVDGIRTCDNRFKPSQNTNTSK